MSPLKLILPSAAAALVALTLQVQAQINAEYKITNVEPNFIEAPSFSGSNYTKRSKPKSWLEVEVAFEWESRLKVPKYTDELTFTYYILLNNAALNQDRKPTLLVGTVTHASIPQEKDMHSVVYIAPRSIERFFDGKPPTNAKQSVLDIGVTISKQGQIVAQSGYQNKTGAWWPQYQQTPGYVLNKNETPFASLAWDYYEAIKPKSGL